MIDAIPLVCPACRTALDRSGRARPALSCNGCARSYPVVAGIPDLRLRSDRYLSLDADRAKAEALASLNDLDFAGLLRAYWGRTPEVPRALARGYTEVALDGVRRGAAVLDAVGTDIRGARVLDVGTGTGGLVAAAAGRGATAVGVDIALRWLVIARRRLAELGIEATLIAADGARLPFEAGAFDLVTSIETLEHAEDPQGVVAECLGAVAPGGLGYIVAGNRFSLAADPVLGLWGVGYLPRRIAPSYVRRRRRTRSQFYRPVSAAELRSMFNGTARVQIAPAPLPPARGDASSVRRALALAYERARSRRGARSALAAVAPFLAARAQRRPRAIHPQRPERRTT